MQKFIGLFALLMLLSGTTSAQLDTIFNLNHSNGHFIKGDTIWLVSRHGVVKRQCSTGAVLKIFTHSNIPASYHTISSVYVDLQDRMWLYLEAKGVAMLDGNHWSYWPPEEIQPVMGGYGGKIVVDNAGVAWVGAPYISPMCLKNGQWQQPPDPGITYIDPREMKIGTDGNMWVVNGIGGIYRHNGASWESVVDISVPVTNFALAPGGGFYTCGYYNGVTDVYYYADENADRIHIGTLQGQAYQMAVAPSGKIYLAGQFSGGIAFYENNQWQFLQELGGIDSGSQVHQSLSVDPQGHLWDAASFFGHKQYDGAQWHQIWTGPAGYEHGAATSDGLIWFGYLNMLSKYDPATGQTEYVDLKPEKQFQNNMVGLEPGLDGAFYAARQRGELTWYDGDGHFKTTVEMADQNFAWDSYVRLAVDPFSGALFYHGWDAFSDLIRYNAKTGQRSTLVQYHNTDPLIPFQEFYYFDMDRSCRLWINTDKGLVYWKNGAWKTFYEPGPVIDFPEMMEAGANGVWIYSGTEQKIQYFTGTAANSWPILLDVANGEQVFKLYADSRNWLWCLTSKNRVMYFNGYDWVNYDPNQGDFPLYTMSSMFDDAQGNMWFLNGDDIAVRLHIPAGAITGQLFYDQNNDCVVQSGEPGIGGFRLVFDNGQQRIETVASNTGRFSVPLPPGNYSASVIPLTSLGVSCQSAFSVVVAENETSVLEIPVQTVLHAPILSVRLGTSILRTCREVTYSGTVCNEGNLAADSAVVTLELPTGLTFITASVPYTTDSSGLIFLQIGQVDENVCEDFSFTAMVSCDGTVVALGQSLCVTAHVSPDSLPSVGSSAWTGPSMEVRGRCTGNAVVFTVKNLGGEPPLTPLEYQVVRDAYLEEKGALSLNVGASQDYSFVADGATWRFQMEQAPGHPSAMPPSVAVEGCVPAGHVGQRSTGFVAQYDNATGSPFDYTDCHDVIGSYDPNDKASQPTGWGDLRQIPPGQVLHYNIRFQNTGTDTAFRVVVRDTLDAALDLNTFRPEVSSHPFQVELDNLHRAVAFIFDPILLPDSNQNELASHGFIQFAIRTNPNALLGTTIGNRASIYFDFNAPVVTNWVEHTLDTGFIRPKPSPPPYQPEAAMSINPNPARAEALLGLDNFDPAKSHVLELFDANGRKVRHVTMPDSPFVLKRGELGSGVYQVVIWSNGKKAAVGQVIFHE